MPPSTYSLRGHEQKMTSLEAEAGFSRWRSNQFGGIFVSSPFSPKGASAQIRHPTGHMTREQLPGRSRKTARPSGDRP